MFRGGFFFFGLRALFVVPGTGAGAAIFGAFLRALKELMNSRALGESPRRFLRCSAAASFGSAEVYSTICSKESWSRGRRCESWFVAQADEAIWKRKLPQ